ncbi:hypothetical protein SZ63_07775 [Methanoculleus sediminis]|uniref:Major facilitator superfamily (MFS) profile domain-containing protein n=1 Tax=Methanoculleus sediminis TaxID=1550566 RepID=A0A0H1QZ83_9EURY|nr:MFS transporter [Methanoculleus sediminis]KLK87906.1 hypothetical protein SZ63_07775 [Methanoculleus sediminis]
MAPTENDRLSVFVIALSAFMGTAAMSSVNIALPLIMQEFDSTLGVVSWVLNGYMLVLAGFCVIIGRGADTRGLKRTFLEGTLLFSIGSLLCFLAWDILTLIMARALQALGAAMFIAGGPALISATIAGSGRAVGQSWVTSASLFGTAAGIGAGGVISGLVGWRPLFVIMIVLGVGVYLIGRICLAGPAPRPGSAPFDYTGSVLLFGTLTTLLSGLSLDYHPGVSDTIPRILYGSAILCAAAFILNVRRVEDPVISLALFRDRRFSAGLASSFLMYIIFGGIMFLLPFVLIMGLHQSVITAGIILMTASVAGILVAPVAGYLAGRYGPRPVCIAAVILTGCTLFGFVEVLHGSLLHGIVLIALFRIALALYYAPATTLILDSCPKDRVGSGSGILLTGRYAAYTIGIALFLLVFESVVYGAGLPDDGSDIIPRLTPALMRSGYAATFLFAAALTVPALICSYFAHGRRSETQDPGPVPADDRTCDPGF